MLRSPETHRVHGWVKVPVLLGFLSYAYCFDVREVMRATVGSCRTTAPVNQSEADVERCLVEQADSASRESANCVSVLRRVIVPNWRCRQMGFHDGLFLELRSMVTNFDTRKRVRGRRRMAPLRRRETTCVCTDLAGWGTCGRIAQKRSCCLVELRKRHHRLDRRETTAGLGGEDADEAGAGGKCWHKPVCNHAGLLSCYGVGLP
jgi:hypothetical protein